MLLRLEASIGLDVWVARNDKTKSYKGHRFGCAIAGALARTLQAPDKSLL
jgi:hypothetical protein